MKNGTPPSTFSAGERKLLSFLTRWPGWAIGGGIAILVVGAVAFGGYTLASKPHITIASSAQSCANHPTKLASLFSDSQTTMIRLSNPDFSSLQVLRTEPANVLPGMFQALLGLSSDNTRLAYVTADNELLDNAHVDYIDPTNPANRVDLAVVAKGLWTVQPAWSPDDKKLAYVTLDQSAGAAGQFKLWVADTSTQPATVGVQADLVADNFTNGNSATICWTADSRIVLIPSNPLSLPSASPTGSASPVPSTSPTTGSPCGVPIFSQNDPAWRSIAMQSQSDTIGGAGCALTSAAMLLNYYGASLTPAQLNTCLAGSADPLAWKSVPKCTNGLISGGDRIDFAWADLDALLAAGRPAIVGMLGGQNGSHFVVVTQGGGGVADSYKITDPWDATTYKTLGGYINDGYTPAWIISFTGPGHNCARLIKGLVPAIPTLQNGIATTNPVTIDISPSLKNLKFLGILKLSSGAIQKDTFNMPLPFTKITSGTTISDEGIYQVLVTTQAPSQPPHTQLYRFTIDKTPPAVDLTLLNPRASGDRAQSIGHGGASGTQARPLGAVLDRPGKIQVTSSDTLSGVKDIKYSLDGAALAEYSSDNTFNRVLQVSGCGDHSMRIQGFDAAGNLRDVTKTFTVYCPPVPSPIPTRPPPQCTASLTLNSLSSSASQSVPGGPYDTATVSWSASGGCAPFHGTVTGSYIDVLGAPHTLPHSISALSGSASDKFTCGNLVQKAVITYALTLADSVGHQVSGSTRVTVC